MWRAHAPLTVRRGTAGQRGGAVDEALRMLGREHQADLDREALKRRWAALARGSRPAVERPRQVPKRRRLLLFRVKAT